MAEQNILPLIKNVVIEPYIPDEKQEKVTETGFIITKKNTTQNQPQYGKIIAIGPEVQSVQVGDIVLFKEFIPTKFTLNNEIFLLLNEDDILAKLI